MKNIEKYKIFLKKMGKISVLAKKLKFHLYVRIIFLLLYKKTVVTVSGDIN